MYKDSDTALGKAQYRLEDSRLGTYYEFFAGGGMAKAGLGNNWECLFANDFCGKKTSSYRENWGGEHLIQGDIATIKTTQLSGVADLAWASFPCQDLSLAGSGRGLKGERSGTFLKFVDLMRELKDVGRNPRIIALENVLGAVTSHEGTDFEAIIEAIANLGYQIGAVVIDAVHFVPQSRPRLFVIAVDENTLPPSNLVADAPVLAWHTPAIIRAYGRLPIKLQNRWVWWQLPEPPVRNLTLDDVIDVNSKNVEWHLISETERLLSMMTPINRQKVELAQKTGQLKIGTIYKRMREGIQRAEVRFDGVAGCLRTPKGGSSLQTIIVVQGTKIKTRLLSPREAARLMGLDDNYRLPERNTYAYQLVGDGVAVPVVAHLSQYLFEPVLTAMQRSALARVA